MSGHIINKEIKKIHVLMKEIISFEIGNNFQYQKQLVLPPA